MALIRDVMTAAVFLIPAGTPIEQAILEMKRKHVGMLVVVDSGEIAGIITERDILHNLDVETAWQKQAVDTVMGRAPLILEPETRVSEAIQRLMEGLHRYAPVVNRKREPIGVVSLTDLARFLGNNLFIREVLGGE